MPDFTNDTINIDSLPRYEKVPFLPIHKKHWNVVVINLFIFALFLFAAIAVVFLSVYSNRETETGIGFYLTLLIAALAFTGFLFWVNRIAFKKKSYAIREKDVLYKSGVLATSTTIIPFNRIQHIAVSEGVLSRMYDLASIEIYTAGGSSSDLRIPGIEKEKAYSIKEFLMNNVNGNINSNINDNINSNINDNDKDSEDNNSEKTTT